MNIETVIDRIGLLSRITDPLTALASAFKEDSAGRRALQPMAPVLRATEQLLTEIHLTRLRSWPMHESQPILDLIVQHATLRYRFGADGSQMKYQLGPWPILAHANSRGHFRTPASLPEIASELAGMMGAEGSTIALREAGDFPSRWSAKIESSPPSSMSTLTGRVSACLSEEIKNGPRSYVLLGPPGTGKSIAARQLAAPHGPAVSVSGMRTTEDGIALARLWGAKAIIIDDFERCITERDLTALETARACGLLIMTANSLESVAPAILRPGRVDRVIKYEGLDPCLASAMAADVPQSVIEPTKTVAELNEARIRWLTWGADEPQLP